MNRARSLLWSAVAACLFLHAASTYSQETGGMLHDGGIPHQPNFLGKNICIGIDTSAVRSEFHSPTIVTSMLFGTQHATHRLVFDSENVIEIAEDLVPRNACEGLPIDNAVWSDKKVAHFCLTSWDKDLYVKVDLGAKLLSKRSGSDVLSTLYGIGPCKVGDIAPDERVGYFYGEIVKVGSMPIRLGKENQKRKYGTGE